MRVVTLIPWRSSNDARRIWCWDITRPYLEELGYEIFTGEPPFKEWARSHAINAAAEAAGKWDVALVGDADTIPCPDSIARAVTWVESTGGAVRPHHDRHMLTPVGSVVVSQRGTEALTDKHLENKWSGGGLLVLTRDAWEAAGGYDESFIGWGHEDTAFNLRLLKTSSWDRLPGDAWHLHHSTAGNKPRRESTVMYRKLLVENRDLMKDWASDKGLTRRVEEIF